MNYEDKLIQMKPILIGFLLNRGMTFVDIQDLYQDLFIKVKITLETGITFKNERMFQAWIYKIVRNMHIDTLRKKRRSKETEMTEWKNEKGYSNILSLKADIENNIEDNIIFEDSVNEILTAVSKLPKEQKDIVDFRLFKEMSYKDIVEMTGIGINTLIGQFRYAKINLKRMLL